MALVGFESEPVSLHVKEVCFEEEQDIPNRRVMHTNVKYLSCVEVEASGHFQLSDMRYDDRNVVTERVSTTVLQLYLIWTPAQILDQVFGAKALGIPKMEFS